MELSNSAKVHAFRLLPHQDLKDEITAWAQKNRIKAGAIVTCVGSLEQVHLRFANQKKSAIEIGHFEILSLAGTFSDASSHLHLAVADSNGRMIGGHVLGDNRIYTTAEIVAVELTEMEFLRQKDDPYGYHELVVKRRP
jgi:predicted DNA-binding protein with PD1-like motif